MSNNITYISGLKHTLNLDELIEYVKEGELDIEVNEPDTYILTQQDSMRLVNEIERLREKTI